MHLPDFAPSLADDFVRPFYEGVALGEMRLPTCPACGRHYWYPPHVMPCHPELKFEWRAVSPVAEVYSFTTIERSLLPGAKRSSTPYTIVMAEPLDAPGARIIGVLTGGDEIGCGDHVRLTPVPVGDHIIPGFARIEGNKL